MRGRHPDLFSDSIKVQELSLPQAVFEHHLETLSSRNQEAQFEHFARALSERTICPNIRPQTGPMGGGDGKVDGETYPVAKQISELWWVGSPEGEAQPWAFAFSVKKQWQGKCRSDVEKIAGTERGYGRIYFITSQSTKASTRADIEKELLEKFGIPVTILDRSWIVQQVYDRNFLPLAVEKLNITGVSTDTARPGPRDTARLSELETLDAQIADPTRYEGVKYQLVEDMLDAAILARGLERSNAEVEGRLVQTKRLAAEVGDSFQMQRAAYAHAWTAFWWFEDFALFNALYSDVEKHAEGTFEADHLELLVNLWQLLQTSLRHGQVSADDADFDARTQRLTDTLKLVAANEMRPNNAHQAVTFLAFMDVSRAAYTRDGALMDGAWTELKRIVEASDVLGTYPFETLFSLAKEMGEHIDSEAFDTFFETLIDAMRRRRSEGEAGSAYVERAFQKLELGKPYDAIRLFGKAEGLLIKDEYRDELVSALAGGSMAYERAGLLWAARNKVLVAAERSLSVFMKEGQVIRAALLILRRLAWLELQLGRVPHLLATMALANVVERHLTLDLDTTKRLGNEIINMAALLGLLLMRTRYEDLSLLETLPETLERSGLDMAKVGLLHALGQDGALRSEGITPDDETDEGMAEFFDLWLKQPAGDDLPGAPVLPSNGNYRFESTILGCRIIIDLPESHGAMALTESFIGGLEALLATSNQGDVFTYREDLKIRLVPGPNTMRVPTISFAESHAETSVITYPEAMAFADAGQLKEFTNWLRETLLFLMPRMIRFRDLETWFKKILGDEDGLNRALALGNIVVVTENVFGRPPKLLLSDWLLSTAPHYPLLRAAQLELPAKGEPKKRGAPKFGKGRMPEGMIDPEAMRHGDMKIRTPIDMPLWDKAGWTGVAYQVGGGMPPVAALMFTDRDAAGAIFEGLREKYGDDDPKALRVAIVKNLSKANPHEYGWIVGPSLSELEDDGNNIVGFISRVHRMTPSSSQNLEMFQKAFETEGEFLLVPAAVSNPGAKVTSQSSFAMNLGLHIRMKRLEVRDAWTIEENDPDSSVFRNDDDLIVPDGVDDAPGLTALARVREMRARNGYIED